MPAKAVPRSKASAGTEQKSSRSDRRRPKGERGLTSSQALALHRDVFDDEHDVRHRRVLDEELSEASDGGVIEHDEEISSDDGDDDIVVRTSKKTKANTNKAQKQGGAAKMAAAKRPVHDDDDDDAQSIGSSLDGAELADLSHMLSDDDDGAQLSFNARKANRNEAREANHAMLHSIGLKVSNKPEKDGDDDDDDGGGVDGDRDGGAGDGGAWTRRRRRERTEARDESSALPQSSAPLTVDALLNSLATTEKYAKLAKEMGVAVGTKPSGKGLQGVSGIGGGSKFSHVALSAPLEAVEKKRIERRAATAAAHADVSGWDSAVRQDEQAERLSFPVNRPPKYGVSTGAIASAKAEGDFEQGIEKLLNEQGLSEAAVAQSEAEALAQMRSTLSEADVEKRVAELKKMRDLLFYHELKAKRVSKIKSKAYRKVHKKAGKMRSEQAETMGGLDKRTAQALALKREVERVQERMRLKHKNTSRWARHALKQQKNNPHIKQAVQEQIAKGEELRRKQLDANSREPKDSDEDSDSDEDDDDDDDDDAEGSGKTGLLWKLQSEKVTTLLPEKIQLFTANEEPEVPEKGLFGMAFMRRAMERQKKETEQMIEELKEMKDTRRDDDGSDASEQEGDGGEKDEDGELSAAGDDDDVYRDPSAVEANEARKARKASKQGSETAGASMGRRKIVPSVSKRSSAAEERSMHFDEVPASGKERVAMRVKTPITLTAALPTASEVSEKDPTATTGGNDGAATSSGDGGAKKGSKRARARLTESEKKAKNTAPATAKAAASVAAKANVIDERGDWPAGVSSLDLELVPAASSAAFKASKSSSASAKAASILEDFVPGELRATGLPEKPLIVMEDKSKGGAQTMKGAGESGVAPQGKKQRKTVQFSEEKDVGSAVQNGDKSRVQPRDDEPTGFGGMFTDDSLTDGAALLQPTSTQQALLAEAFPESAKDFEAEKAKLIESEAPPDESEPILPGWGDWGGLGSRPSARAEAKKRSAQEARAELLAAAAKRRKDAALSNVIICEKRDKKAVRFTTAGVPYPFTSREQFEKSLRNPLGTEWNTRATHIDMVAPRISTVKGAAIQPIAEHRKGAPVSYRRNK